MGVPEEDKPCWRSDWLTRRERGWCARVPEMKRLDPLDVHGGLGESMQTGERTLGDVRTMEAHMAEMEAHALRGPQ